jgi:hypothetical protein
MIIIETTNSPMLSHSWTSSKSPYAVFSGSTVVRSSLDKRTETLNQIIAGVVAAQEKARETRAFVNPRGPLETDEAVKSDIREVEFNIAIAATQQKGTKGGLGIFVSVIGAGMQGKTDTSSSTVTRIKFSVSIIFPRQRPFKQNQTGSNGGNLREMSCFSAILEAFSSKVPKLLIGTVCRVYSDDKFASRTGGFVSIIPLSYHHSRPALKHSQTPRLSPPTAARMDDLGLRVAYKGHIFRDCALNRL